MKTEETSPSSTQPQAAQGRILVDPPVQVPPQDKQISNLSPLFQGRMSDPTPYLSESAQNNGYTSKHHEKARGNSSGTVSDSGNKAAAVDAKKRVKRKPEAEAEFHIHPHKMHTQSVKEKLNSSRPIDDSNLIFQQPKPNQMPATTTSDQPS